MFGALILAKRGLVFREGSYMDNFSFSLLSGKLQRDKHLKITNLCTEMLNCLP